MGIKDSSLWAREILSFLETAKNGSINGTAEANAMKQSNLSRTLKSGVCRRLVVDLDVCENVFVNEV